MELTEVQNNVFVSAKKPATNLSVLKTHEIETIINLGARCPCDPYNDIDIQRDLDYIHIPIVDGKNELHKVERAVRIVENELTSDRRILVHCSAGVSRSPSILAASMADSPEEYEEHLSRFQSAGVSVSVSAWLKKQCKEVLR